MLKRYGLMGHVLWVHYSVPLEYCKAWDQRLCPIGCLSHLLMAPLNTPSSFQLHLSSFLLNYFFPFDLCFHGWRVSLGSHSKAPKCSVWKALSPGPWRGSVTTPLWGWRPPATCSPASNPMGTSHKRGTEAHPALRKHSMWVRQGMARPPSSFQSSQISPFKDQGASFTLA